MHTEYACACAVREYKCNEYAIFANTNTSMSIELVRFMSNLALRVANGGGGGGGAAACDSSAFSSHGCPLVTHRGLLVLLLDEFCVRGALHLYRAVLSRAGDGAALLCCETARGSRLQLTHAGAAAVARPRIIKNLMRIRLSL